MCLYKIDKIFVTFMPSEVGQIPWVPMGTPRNPLPTESVGKTIFNKTGQTMIKSVWHRIWSTRVHKWKKKGWIVSIRWRLAAFGFCVKIFKMLKIFIVFIILFLELELIYCDKIENDYILFYFICSYYGKFLYSEN